MSSTPPAELKQLGRYDLTRVLGKGAMGIVYEGMDPKLHRRVAIKTILKGHLDDDDAAKEYSMRFMREAQAVARLNHPNIVQVYDFGEEGDVAYIVMEFIKGKELKTFFDNNDRFELKEAVRIMCELLDALDFAHESGIVHRDIKPANVMLDSQARVKLADFGVARVTDDKSSAEKTQAGTMVGTPAYMSPEQITGGNIDRRTDLFSAGIILYQFLTGEKPFTGSGAWTIAKKIIQDHPPLPSSINNTISPLFDAVVNKALSKTTEGRYQTAKEFGQALKRALEGKAEEDDADKTVFTPGGIANMQVSPQMAVASPTGTKTSTTGSGSQEVELEFWRAIKDGNDPDDFELYVQQFPNGIYAALAKRKIAKLKGVAPEETGAKAREQEKKEAEEAAKREAEVRAKLAEEKEKLEEQLRQREEEYKRREAEVAARAEAEAKARKEEMERAKAEAEMARQEAAAEAERARQAAAAEAEKARKEAAELAAKREAEAQARYEAEMARREAEAKAKREAEEKERAALEAKREAERAAREAERTKAEAEARAKAEADAKARREEVERTKAEAERTKAEAAKARAEAEARAKKEADERAKQQAEAAKREAELKKKLAEAPKAKLPVVPIVAAIIGVAVVGGGAFYYIKKDQWEAEKQAVAMLQEAANASKELQAAQAKQLESLKALEAARAAEEAARKSGDMAALKKAQEDARRAEDEAKKQAELVKQRAAAAEDAKKKADDAKKKAEQAEAPKKDAPKQEIAKAPEAPKVEAPKPEAPKAAPREEHKEVAKAPAPEKKEEKKEQRVLSRSERERLADEEAARKLAQANAAAKKDQQVQVAAVAPSAVATPSAAPSAPTVTDIAPSAPAVKPGVSENEVLFAQAQKLEADGKANEAVRVYRRLARAGHGKSAKRLGDIFDRGVPGVPRDYQESLSWYETARKLGETVETAGKR